MAQVYRFVVDEAAQPDGNARGALRVYEMELYAYEGTADYVANGLFKADTAGEYTVTYLKGNAVLNTTTVTVIGDQIPDETEPEVTEPEVTEPEVTEPEVTEPEVTEPEVTEPEVTEPKPTKPQGGSADTGDAFSALWIFAMTISLAGAASLLVINKKRRF